MTRGPLLLTSHSNHGLASVPLRNHLRIETRIGFTTLLDAMVLRLPDSSLFWSRSRCGLQPILSWSAPLTSQNDDRGAVSQNYPRIVHKYKYKYNYISIFRPMRRLCFYLYMLLSVRAQRSWKYATRSAVNIARSVAHSTFLDISCCESLSTPHCPGSKNFLAAPSSLHAHDKLQVRVLLCV